MRKNNKLTLCFMHYASPTLSSEYYLKEKFHRIFESETFNEKKTAFSDWIFYAQNSDIESLENVLTI